MIRQRQQKIVVPVVPRPKQCPVSATSCRNTAICSAFFPPSLRFPLPHSIDRGFSRGKMYVFHVRTASTGESTSGRQATPFQNSIPSLDLSSPAAPSRNFHPAGIRNFAEKFHVADFVSFG